MAEPSVSERRIRPIKDFIEVGNWKQAASLCDKWHKKGEKSDQFLALKAYVLVNQPDNSQRERGRTEVLQICRREPPITDPEAIHQLQDTLTDLSLHDEEGPKLWERASLAKPGDKAILKHWINRTIKESDWLGAQKAAMAYRKHFPKERQYDFWNIMICFLINQDPSGAEKDRMLFGTLAYRMISKAAELAGTEKDQVLSSGKAISTPEELALLVQIYLRTNRAGEAVQLLQSEHLGPDSKVAKQDPQLALTLLLGALEASKQWQTALDVCQGLLVDERNHGDDRIWKLLFETHYQLGDDSTKVLETVVEQAVSVSEPARAALLADMRLLKTSKSNGTDQTELLPKLQHYISTFGGKSFCFQDLQEFFSTLQPNEVKDLTNVLNDPSEPARYLLGLKIEYSSLLTPSSPAQEWLTFMPKALAFHHSTSSEAISNPEAGLLASLSLVRLWIITKTSTYLLNAVVILTTVISKFDEYYPALILLIQIEKYLGLISMATSSYTKLSTKNMQLETVAHLLLTRISTVHPHQTLTIEATFDPATGIDHGLNMLTNADRSLVSGIRQGLEFGSYSNILENVEMRRMVEHSLNRQIYSIEERRLVRLTGGKDDTALQPRPGQLVDNQDALFFARYSPADEELHTALATGPKQKESWLDAMGLHDHLTTYTQLSSSVVNNASPPPSSDVGKLLDLLRKAREGVETASKEQEIAVELSEAEIASLACHKFLADIVLATAETDIGALLESVASWIRTQAIERHANITSSSLSSVPSKRLSELGLASISSTLVPTWAYLHGSLTRLETLRAISQLLSYLNNTSKGEKSKKRGKNKNLASSSTTATSTDDSPSKAQLEEVSNLVLQGEQAIHDAARSLKTGLSAEGVLGRLVDLAFARSHDSAGDVPEGMAASNECLEKMLDEVKVETLCGEMREAWEDALDGVLSVRIKPMK